MSSIFVELITVQKERKENVKTEEIYSLLPYNLFSVKKKCWMDRGKVSFFFFFLSNSNRKETVDRLGGISFFANIRSFFSIGFRLFNFFETKIPIPIIIIKAQKYKCRSMPKILNLKGDRNEIHSRLVTINSSISNIFTQLDLQSWLIRTLNNICFTL